MSKNNNCMFAQVDKKEHNSIPHNSIKTIKTFKLVTSFNCQIPSLVLSNFDCHTDYTWQWHLADKLKVKCKFVPIIKQIFLLSTGCCCLYSLRPATSQLPGHSRGTCPGWPHLGAATAAASPRRVQNQFRLSKFFSQQWHVD